jgi:hypothetical protein
MSDSRQVLAAFLSTCLAVACGGGSGSPSAPAAPAPTAAPTPTPEPAGVVRLAGATLAPGSTVPVSPMFSGGQQAQQLAFTAAVTLKRDLSGGLVRAWVRTDALRCMGGGLAHLDFQAGVERVLKPASMSNPGSGAPVCALPYSTSQVEIEVVDASGQQLLTQSFPSAYAFVAAP